jgi:hypothetical protein
MANGYQPGQLMMAMQARKEQQSQSFLTGLLAQGTNAGGQFDIVNGKPMYDSGMGMPEKSDAWNQFLSVKGGRVTAQDIQSFESHWKQAEFAKTQKQMGELDKLRLKGFSDKEIRSSVKQSPALYENMLDMITDLRASGDADLMGQAEVIKQYLPEQETKGLVGDIVAGEGGILGDYIAPGLLFGAPTAYSLLRGRGKEAVKGAAKEFRTQRRAVTSDINDKKSSLQSKKDEIKKKAAKLKNPKNSKVIKGLKSETRTLNKDIKDLQSKRSNIKIKDPGSRISRLTSKGYKPGLGTSMATAWAAPKVGEYLAGEGGKEPASLLANLGLLGYGLWRKNPAAAWTGGIGLGAQAYDKSSEIYDYFFGDEE